MTTRSSSCWAAVILALLVPVAARAEPPAVPPSEEQVEIARGIYKEARELYRQGKLKEALDKGLEAYRAAGTPVTALEAGQLLIESGRIVEARDLLRGVGTMPISPRESDRGREARQQASVLATSLDARIPKLAIAGRPRGIDILLDGRPLGAAEPSAWQGVDPGPHTLVVRAEDRTCSTITVTLGEGEVRTIDLHDVASACRLEAQASEPARGLSPAHAERRGEPPAPEEPAAVNHASNPWKWAGLALGGLGVVAVGVGGYLALAAKRDFDAVGSHCVGNVCDASGYRDRTAARSQADVATGTISVGAAAAVGGLLLWFLLPEPRGAGTSDVGRPHLAIGPGMVGVTMRLR